nr:unnamed protein product [Callosobruchus analis]
MRISSTCDVMQLGHGRGLGHAMFLTSSSAKYFDNHSVSSHRCSVKRAIWSYEIVISLDPAYLFNSENNINRRVHSFL